MLCVLGCGTMGRSILSGIFDALQDGRTSPTPSASPAPGTESTATQQSSTDACRPPSTFIACVNRQETQRTLAHEWSHLPDVRVVSGAQANAEAVATADFVLLGSKPQAARSILMDAAMQRAVRGKTLISILAGTTIETLQRLCPESRIVRVMPNTPCRIRQGMSVIVRGDGVSRDTLEVVEWIFQRVGRTLVMEERHIDAATALCGSGPAFMAVILESLTDGGVMMGVPRAQAELLVAQTMLGTACMVQSGQHPALIRNAVATPGGCTIGGLLEMEDGKIRSTLARTIQTATNIAAGLG